MRQAHHSLAQGVVIEPNPRRSASGSDLEDSAFAHPAAGQQPFDLDRLVAEEEVLECANRDCRNSGYRCNAERSPRAVTIEARRILSLAQGAQIVCLIQRVCCVRCSPVVPWYPIWKCPEGDLDCAFAAQIDRFDAMPQG